MKTRECLALAMLALVAGGSPVMGQEGASIMAAMQAYSAAGGSNGGDAVMTGPQADPRPNGVGPAGESGGQVEPWQIWAQQPVAAPLQLEVNVRAEYGTQVTIGLAGQNYTVDGIGLGSETETNRFYPNLKAYQSYPLSVSGANWDYIRVVFKGYTPRHLLSKRGPRAIPRPFRALVDGEDYLDTEALDATFAAGSNSTNWVVEVRPDRGLRPVVHQSYDEVWSRDENTGDTAPGDGQWLALGPGRSSSASSGAFRWSVNLGRLWTGLTAGKVRLNEQMLSSNLFNGAALSYTARSTNQSELHVITNANGWLRQIKAPGALLDIQTTASPTQECMLRFYTPARVGSYTNGLYPILTNSPFVTWRVRNPDSPGAYSRLQIVEERPASRSHAAELSYGNSVWQLSYGAGNEARTERRTVTVNGNSRQETVEILWQSNVLYKAIEAYSQFAWGWELTNVVTHPDGGGLTNRFVYHTDPTVPAAYGRLKERWFPGGRWELYCYPYLDDSDVYQCAGWPPSCGDFADYTGDRDAYLIRVRPWKDAPATPSAATLTNIVVTESRSFNAAVGHHESHRTTEVGFGPDGGPVILDRVFVADGDYYQPEGSYSAHDWGWRGEVNNSFTHTVRFRGTGTWFNDLVRVQHVKTGEADLFEYLRGYFNSTNLTWTPDDTNGVDVAKLKTTGMDYYYLSAYPVAQYTDCFPYDGSSYVIDCVQGKSIQELTILQGGNPVFVKLLGMASIENNAPVFRTIEMRRRAYDSLGHLTNEVWYDGVSNTISRTVYQANWRDANGNDTELKAWEINELGERLNYSYDSQKRPTGITRVGVSSVGGYPAQPDLSTNLTFNVAGWLTQETVSAPGLSLTRSQSFDLAGRVTKTTSFDGVSVTNTYSADARTTTAAFPGGLTKQTERYLDGRLKSVTGDTVVAEYHDYRVDATVDPLTVGTGVERIYYATNNSPRWKEQARTSFGQIATQRMPAFSLTNGTPPLEIVTSFWDDLAFGPMDESPSSVTTPATVALVDGEYQTQYLVEENRYTLYGWTSAEHEAWGYGSFGRPGAQDTTLEWDSGNWWRVSREWWTATPGITRTNVTRERLTGYSSGATWRDLTVTDPNGNLTTIQLTLDQTYKKLTAVTNTPRSTINVTGVTINGLLQSVNAESYSGLNYFYYDGLRRPLASKDALGFATGTTYDTTTGWVLATTNAAGSVTQYAYYLASEANSGKLKSETKPNVKKTYYAYNNRGQLAQVWGDVPFPEERLYNGYGDQTGLRTYQRGSNWSSASWPGAGEDPDVTTWTYDAATGLVLGKFDDVGRGYTNMYHATRTLWRRHWARGVVVTNSFNVFGEPMAKEYSDGTASVTFGDYYPLGQPSSITDAFGTVSFSYDEDGDLLATTYGWDSPFVGLALTNRLDPLYGRDRVVLDAQWPNPYQMATAYGFSTNTGRLQDVRTWYSDQSGTTVTNVTSYAYLANSDLVQTLTTKSNATTVLTTSKTWGFGYRLLSLQAVLGTAGAVVSCWAYDYDVADRRTRATWADGSVWNFQYDDRDELVSGKRVWGDASPVAGQQFEYAFDAIGNRTLTKAGGDTNGANLRLANYTNNTLNQLAGRGVPGSVDVMGAATATATNVSVNSQPADARRVEYYWKQLAVSNSGGPRWQAVTNTATLSNQTATVTGSVLVPPAGQTFGYDADGNLTNDLVWAYRWDGENRLRALEVLPSAASNGLPRVRLEFGYDWQGRRLSKAVLTNWNGSVYSTTNLTRFLYDEWRPVAELTEANALIRSYAWGLDLSGTLDGAGGIGGLLELLDYSTGPPSRHFPCYDGNGNVAALVKSDGTVSARYEYGPFGEPIRVTGPNARTNPFRWSTKYWDQESELSYYGHRYCSPALGRWISRDPIEEDAGISLYAFVKNLPVSAVDSLGMNTLAEEESAAGGAASIGSGGASQAISFLNNVRKAVDAYNYVQNLISDLANLADAIEGGDADEILFSGIQALQAAFSRSLPGGAGRGSLGAMAGKPTDVYQALGKAGETIYVGITTAFDRRAGEHRPRGLEIRKIRGLSGLNPRDARAAEQALIELHGLAKNGGSLINKINSIAKSNPVYAQYLRRGFELLKSAGYPGAQ